MTTRHAAVRKYKGHAGADGTSPRGRSSGAALRGSATVFQGRPPLLESTISLHFWRYPSRNSGNSAFFTFGTVYTVGISLLSELLLMTDAVSPPGHVSGWYVVAAVEAPSHSTAQ